MHKDFNDSQKYDIQSWPLVFRRNKHLYIIMFGATSAPHLLPVHVPNHIILGNICYKTILQGYNASLVKDKKRDFISYGFHIGIYMVKDTV
jgi:hypothetical protein